jgi:glutathione synthase/RimK-type ligase-like ATP-grasp enzyme
MCRGDVEVKELIFDKITVMAIKEAPNAILIVSTKYDPHVDFLIPRLTERQIPFIRFNTEDFPLRSKVTIAFDKNGSHQEILSLPNGPDTSGEDIISVWYRRPAPFEFPEEFALAVRMFAEEETRDTARGLWELLDCLWVNHPEHIRRANSKLHQLNVAHQLGLDIPKTIVTNDPEEAKRFVGSCHGGVVAKPLSRGLVDEHDQPMAFYTSVVKPEQLDEIQRVQYTPAFFQEYVQKDVELRITVVGNQIFTAEIHSQQRDDTRHDWRRNALALEHKEHQLPDEIREKCLALTKTLNLQFGAIDIILTPDGRYVFLEINPNGQWAWIEELTGLPISEALIGLLSKGQ